MEFHPSHLAPCLNCGCGVPPNSVLCDYCSAVFGSSADAEEGLHPVGVICRSCGAESEAARDRCTHCSASLKHTCPGCGKEDIRPSATQCPHCYLARSRFFEQCLENEAEKRTSLASAEARSRRAHFVPLAFSLGFVGLGVSQYFAGFPGVGNGFLILALIFLAFWIWASR